MKQLRIFAIYVMVFCVCTVYAQTEVTDSVTTYEESDTYVGNDDESSASADDESFSSDAKTPADKPNVSAHRLPSNSKDNLDPEMLNEILRYFHKAAQDNQNLAPQKDYSKIYVPIEGKRKFWRRHHLDQRLELSVMAGKDGDNDDYVAKDDDESERMENSKKSMFNYGLNVGYSLVFIPGHEEGNQLRLNRYGFAYSAGLIASYDKNDDYGVTCDFLLKLGIETGYGHNMGLGFDILLGTGKSAGDYVVLYKDNDDVEMLTQPFTKWCFKRGAQFWVRTGMLGSALKNTDIRIFARYVYSKEPAEDVLSDDESIEFSVWQEESWQFGLTFCYTF